MTMDQNLRKEIDACRPHSDDLCAPEMASLAEAVEQNPRVAEVYQRSVRWDAKVAAAMAEVAVPTGLADRLCERLLDSSTSPERTVYLETAGYLETADDLQVASQETLESRTSLHRATRTESAVSRIGPRTWFAAAAAIVVSVTLSLFLSSQKDDETLTVDRLRSVAHEWYAVIADIDRENWKPVLPEILDSHPLSENVDSSALAYSRLGAESFGDPVAYDMTPRRWGQVGKDKAFLVVVPIPSDVVLSGIEWAPPRVPNSSHAPTSGVAVAVWRSDAMLYVLIIQGGHERYEELITRVSPEIT